MLSLASFYEAIIANVPIGILAYTPGGLIEAANGRAHEQFGYQPGELVGQSVQQLLPSLGGPAHLAAPAAPQQALARRKAGTLFSIDLVATTLFMDNEQRTVVYLQNTLAGPGQVPETPLPTAPFAQAERVPEAAPSPPALLAALAQLKQLERQHSELVRALEMEKKTGAIKTRFVTLASHEFRTPLTTVLTSTELIDYYLDAGEPDKSRSHLARIRHSVDHLTNILEEFLSVGLIEEGKAVLRPVPFDLSLLLHDTHTDVRAHCKVGQRLVIGLGNCCPALLQLDISLLRKILVNLLTNAFKYSPEHSVVQLQASCAANQLTLLVQDEGVGIAPEDQQHLFQRFFRADSAVNEPGTGLGLYIVGKYVKALGGTISLTSVLGKGTGVTVVIPYESHPVN
jgi:signal transduction histidine kinase